MRENLDLKLFSLLLAIVLAYVVNSERNTSVIGIVVPLEIQNVPTNKIMVWPAKREAQVTVKGPSFLVGPITSSPPVFKVHLPNDLKNRFVLSLKGSDLVLPPLVQVLSIEPSEMELLFDDLDTREVPVEVPRIGKLADSSMTAAIDVTPKMVTLSGPVSELREVRSVESYPVNLSEISGSTSMELALRLPGTLILASVKRVVAKIEVTGIEEGKPATVINPTKSEKRNIKK